MKYYTKILIGSILLFASSCNEFLDVTPTTNISIPSTADDYQDMLYPLSASYSADAMIGVMGDEVYWSNNFYLNQSTDVCVRRAYLREIERIGQGSVSSSDNHHVLAAEERPIACRAVADSLSLVFLLALASEMPVPCPCGIYDGLCRYVLIGRMGYEGVSILLDRCYLHESYLYAE